MVAEVSSRILSRSDGAVSWIFHVRINAHNSGRDFKHFSNHLGLTES